MSILDLFGLGFYKGLRSSTTVSVSAVVSGRGSAYSSVSKKVFASAITSGMGRVSSVDENSASVSATVRARGSVYSTTKKTPVVSGIVSSRGSAYSSDSKSCTTLSSTGFRGPAYSSIIKKIFISAITSGSGRTSSVDENNYSVSASVRQRGSVYSIIQKSIPVSASVRQRGSVLCSVAHSDITFAATRFRGSVYSSTAKSVLVAAITSGRGSVIYAGANAATGVAGYLSGRGSVHSSCYRKWYANINNSYVASGAGTKASPWNKVQLGRELGGQFEGPPIILLSGVHKIYVSGKWVSTPSDPVISWGYGSTADLITVDIDPDGDLVPWAIDDRYTFTGPARQRNITSSISDFSKKIIYKNGAIKGCFGQFTIGNSTNVEYYNMHFALFNSVSTYWNGLNALNPLKLFGCTITGVDSDTGATVAVAFGVFVEYTDCVVSLFTPSGANAITYGDTTVIAKNSVHTCSVAQMTGTDGGGNQFDWLPAEENVRIGTLQGTPAVGYVTLDLGASTYENFYSGDFIEITAGTGVGQKTRIRYNNSIDISGTNGGLDCRISSFPIAPDNTSQYKITRFKLCGLTGWTDPLDFRYLGDLYVAPRGTASEITATAFTPFTGFETGLAFQGDRIASRGIGAFYFLGGITSGSGRVYPIISKKVFASALVSWRGSVSYEATVPSIHGVVSGRGFVYSSTKKTIYSAVIVSGRGAESGSLSKKVAVDSNTRFRGACYSSASNVQMASCTLSGSGRTYSACKKSVIALGAIRSRGSVYSICRKSILVSAIINGRGRISCSTAHSADGKASNRNRGSIISYTAKRTLVVSRVTGTGSVYSSGFNTTSTIAGRGFIYSSATKKIFVSANLINRGRTSSSCAKLIFSSCSLRGRGSVYSIDRKHPSVSAIASGRGNISSTSPKLCLINAVVSGSGRVSSFIINTIPATSGYGFIYSAATKKIFSSCINIGTGKPYSVLVKKVYASGVVWGRGRIVAIAVNFSDKRFDINIEDCFLIEAQVSDIFLIEAGADDCFLIQASSPDRFLIESKIPDEFIVESQIEKECWL